MTTTPYIKVILNSEAEILDFHCNLFDTEYAPEEVIGKNWFDVFVDESDEKQNIKLFQKLFDGREEEWQTFNNDIVCKKDQHKLMDFHNQVFHKDGVKYINCVGIEHFTNQNNSTFKYLNSAGIEHFVDQGNTLFTVAEELTE